MTINPDGGGGTDMVPASGLGYAVAGFVGYIGPSAAGLVAAWLISIGRIVVVLWLGRPARGHAAAGPQLLRRNRDSRLRRAALPRLALHHGRRQTAVAYGVTWFLLLSGPKRGLERGSEPKDATILAGRTILWAAAWSFLWLVGTIAALVAGGAILV